MAVDSGVSHGEWQPCEVHVSLWLGIQDGQGRKKPFHRMDAIWVCQAHLPASPVPQAALKEFQGGFRARLRTFSPLGQEVRHFSGI